MEPLIHSIDSLFDQLGLDSSEEGINRFIKENFPLPDSIELHKAAFWSKSQATFLKQVVDEDADWAEIVDRLNAMLRESHI